MRMGAAAVHGVALRLYFVFQQLHQLIHHGHSDIGLGCFDLWIMREKSAWRSFSSCAFLSGPCQYIMDLQICCQRQHNILKYMQLSSLFAGESAFVWARVFGLSRTYRWGGGGGVGGRDGWWRSDNLKRGSNEMHSLRKVWSVRRRRKSVFTRHSCLHEQSGNVVNNASAW